MGGQYALEMEDTVKRKLKKWLGWGSTVSGGLAAIILPMYLLYADIRDDARQRSNEVEEKQDIGYEKVVMPALKELQDLVGKASAWADETDDELRAIEKENKILREKLIKLEAYVDVLYRRQGSPRVRVPDPPPNLVAAKPEPKHKKPAEMPKAKLYDDLNTAQQVLAK